MKRKLESRLGLLVNVLQVTKYTYFFNEGD